uniref:LRRCT domain-containing protein n=1 Tax=Ciona savignyi TaxID=51511 RepID=H2YEH5_CIOSA
MKGHAHTCTTETSLSNNPEEKQVTSEDTVEKHHSKECPAGCTCLSLNTDCTGDGQNQLQAVPRGMPNDSTSVSLASNHITSISATDFQNLTKMTELRLDNSHITTIDERAFLTTVNLTTLTMRDNKLAKLPENIFKNLKKLSILVLDNNELGKNISKVASALKKLQWLYIRNNKITMIEQHAFAGLVAIRFIHMENNRISTLHIDTVKDLTEKDTCTIQKMFLVGNPINCPCDMKDLQAYLEKNKKRLRTLFGDGIQCQFPADLDGQYLKDVPKNYKCNRVQTDVKVIYEAKPSGGAMTGLWFGGLVIGIILCIALFIVWKKRGCNFRPHSMSYRNIPGNDEVEEHRSLTTDNYGNGSEAFV